MKYLKPLILESKQLGNLYHFTNYINLISIISEFKLMSRDFYEDDSDRYVMKDYKYISFTRNPNLWKTLNYEQQNNGNITFETRITLDGDKLSDKYRIMPHDDNYKIDRVHYYFDKSKTNNKLSKKNVDLGDESEERLYTLNDTISIKNMVKEVVLYFDDYEHYQRIKNNLEFDFYRVKNICTTNNISLNFFIKETNNFLEIGNSLLENNIWDIKKDLKHFHHVLDLDITIKELMKSLDAIHMDLKTIFPIFDGDETLKELQNWKLFKTELGEYELKMSELFDTNDLQTFSRIPMKWYWLYSKDATELDTPIYIMFKYYYRNKWSDIQLYYIQNNVDDFLKELSSVVLEFRMLSIDKRWFYKTSNSGMNWSLEKDIKKIKEGDVYKEVHSDIESETFRASLRWETILDLSKRTDLELFIY